MKKNFTIAIILSLIVLKTEANEPVYSLNHAEKPAKNPYSLNYNHQAKKTSVSDPANAIKLKLFPLILSVFTVQYERSLTDNISVACDLSFLRRSTSSSGDMSGSETQSLTTTAFGISPELRFYPGGNASQGFFVGPYATYMNLAIKGEYTNSNGISGTAELNGINAIGGGVLLGWKWLIKEAFVIETHIGYNYLNVNIPTSIEVNYSDGTKEFENGPSLNFSGGLPTAGVSLGYAF